MFHEGRHDEAESRFSQFYKQAPPQKNLNPVSTNQKSKRDTSDNHRSHYITSVFAKLYLLSAVGTQIIQHYQTEVQYCCFGDVCAGCAEHLLRIEPRQL